MKICATALTITVVMLGCKSKTPQELIVNKWKVTDISGGRASEMPDSVQQNIKKATVEFGSDGKFHLSDGQKPYEGSYTLDAEGKHLNLNPTTGEGPETDSIADITADKLVIVDVSGTKFECTVKK